MSYSPQFSDSQAPPLGAGYEGIECINFPPHLQEKLGATDFLDTVNSLYALRVGYGIISQERYDAVAEFLDLVCDAGAGAPKDITDLFVEGDRETPALITSEGYNGNTIVYLATRDDSGEIGVPLVVDTVRERQEIAVSLADEIEPIRNHDPITYSLESDVFDPYEAPSTQSLLNELAVARGLTEEERDAVLKTILLREVYKREVATIGFDELVLDNLTTQYIRYIVFPSDRETMDD